ncbi:MAG: c-type cytochrome biogenesis protein CcsB [Dermatophilaceae bacterium]
MTGLTVVGLAGYAVPAAAAAQAPSTQLAEWSNLALYSAMAVYTIAMLLFASYLAALGPAPASTQADASADVTLEAPARALVAVPGSADVSTPGPPPGPPAAAPDEQPSARARRLGGIAMSMTWLATLLLAASVVQRGVSVMRAPWGNMFEFVTTSALCAVVAYLLLARRFRWEWLGIFVVGPVLLTLGLALLAFYTEAAELMPALKDVWLLIHVTVAVLAVALFTIAFSVGIVYLVKLRREAQPTSGRTFVESLPSAAALERTAYGLNMVGFILWTFTLVAGAIWAQRAWGSYWTWDPKEVWTFVVWVVYAAYMHARATAGWEPRKATWIALAGFVTIIINFTVVNLYFVGQHSYSGVAG